MENKVSWQFLHSHIKSDYHYQQFYSSFLLFSKNCDWVYVFTTLLNGLETFRNFCFIYYNLFFPKFAVLFYFYIGENIIVNGLCLNHLNILGKSLKLFCNNWVI